MGVEASVDSCGLYLRTHRAGQGPNSLPCDTGHTHTLGATVSTHRKAQNQKRKKVPTKRAAVFLSMFYEDAQSVNC